MRKNITEYVSAADQVRVQQLVADRNQSSKVVWRAKIISATAEGLGTTAITRSSGKSKMCVWRWQERFAEEGVEGLLHDKTRPPGTPPLPTEVKPAVLAKTATGTPPDATHWNLKPHLTRTFKVSNDPLFEEKVTDVVGLYMPFESERFRSAHDRGVDECNLCR
jgi:transposase